MAEIEDEVNSRNDIAPSDKELIRLMFEEAGTPNFEMRVEDVKDSSPVDTKYWTDKAIDFDREKNSLLTPYQQMGNVASTKAFWNSNPVKEVLRIAKDFENYGPEYGAELNSYFRDIQRGTPRKLSSLVDELFDRIEDNEHIVWNGYANEFRFKY